MRAPAGLAWGPFMGTSIALFQRTATPAQLPQVLAANGAVTVVSVPLGTMAGGPLVAILGARETLLTCATATIALGTAAVGLKALRRHRHQT